MTGERGPLAEFGKYLEIQNLGLNLPFAIAFLLVAARGVPPWNVTLLVLIAFIAARNAGHSFNRWADRNFDAANPRTQDRALVTGRYSERFALTIAFGSAAVMLVAAALLNWLALALAPLALAILFGYSYSKRYSLLTTPFLGLVEAITPAAAYVAVTASLPLGAVFAVLALLAWGTAFETIHSLGDMATDARLGLHSVPLRLGTRRSLALIIALHAGALGLFVVFGRLASLGALFDVGIGAMAIAVAATDWQLVREPDQTHRAFVRHFLLSALFLAGVLLALAFPHFA
ncbi:MAG: UbiA family prenyltransferase [Thermoplasmata archaeon]|nr:UbiA family prenyltransferase [Thermoplasmata archaeon]